MLAGINVVLGQQELNAAIHLQNWRERVPKSRRRWCLVIPAVRCDAAQPISIPRHPVTLVVMAPVETAVRLAFAVLATLLACCHVDVISDRDMTATAMAETSVRIGLYVQANGKLPADLTVIPVRPGYLNRTTGGWKRPLHYRAEGDVFTLGSLCRDGVAGGTGDDADWLRTYRARNGQVEEVP